MNKINEHGDFRTRVLNMISPFDQPIPPIPFAAFVWPTELCSIGCAHCSYSSPKKSSHNKRFIADFAEKVVGWAAESGIKKFVVCGGGEPLDEPEFVVKAIEYCSSLGLDFEIYTSGVSRFKANSVDNYLSSWLKAWGSPKRANQKFTIRLSVDAFHEELIGLRPLVEWINRAEIAVPGWRISIRALRVKTDFTMQRLVDMLGGELNIKNKSAGSITLSSGKKIPIAWKGFVFEGRGVLKQLTRLKLELDEVDFDKIRPFFETVAENKEIGRPLSLHHAVSLNRIDLEIHANGIVHILQSQAPDLRMSLFEYSWTEISEIYYRDPLLHTTMLGGLSAISDLLDIRNNETGEDRVPFSIEKLENEETRSWLTAQSILFNSPTFSYNSDVLELAKKRVS